MQHHPGTTNWMVRCLAGSRITTQEPQTEIACCLVVLILLHSRTTCSIELLELKSTTRRHKSCRFLSSKPIDPGGGEVGWGGVISQWIREGMGKERGKEKGTEKGNSLSGHAPPPRSHELDCALSVHIASLRSLKLDSALHGVCHMTPSPNSSSLCKIKTEKYSSSAPKSVKYDLG